MYPALILREEIVCLIILLFLFFMAKAFKMGKDSKSFNRLTWFAIFHVAFDMITLITVNNQDVVPPWINAVAHLIFYMSAVLFANELCFYILCLCIKNISKCVYWVGHILLLIYIIVAEIIGIQYETIDGVVMSRGLATYIGFAIASVYFIVTFIVLLKNAKKLDKMVVFTIVPILIVLLLAEIIQMIEPTFLFTGGAVTIVTVAFFFSLENPVYVFRQKALIDAMTGVRSRQSYDIDIEEIDKLFHKDPNVNYIFAFCDINNLKSVNGLFGHMEGDRYISLVANVFMTEFKHAEKVYRMGGDEFFVVFHNVDEETVIKECRAVQKGCIEIDPGKLYTPSVAIGYAVVGPEYKSVRDVVRAADFMMYRNKTEMKGSKAFIGDGTGTRLNPMGLTDVLFDAICSANERIYPFMMNMETGVTRISPNWNKEFGMGGEFFANFDIVWTEHIHPEDRKAYTDDIVATISGRQKYHNRDYRAKNAKGEYVYCTCHGAIYQGKNGEPDLFSGYVINHGVEEKIDAVTGLRNYFVMDEIMQDIINNKGHAVVLKLGLNNFERLNMLYGYERSKDTARVIVKTIKDIIEDNGEVFCNEGKNITILFKKLKLEEVTDIYNNISSSLSHGIDVKGTIVTVNISGGVAEIKRGFFYKKERVRTSLLYALDESRYFKYNKLVVADLTPDETEELSHEFLAQVHSDATNKKDNFILRYQPVLDTQSGALIGAEALLRWNNPAYGEVPPGKFIDFLETDSCYYDLGLYIIRQAVKAACEFREHSPDFMISINITALQLRNDGFDDALTDILEEYAFPPKNVVLELTERVKELDTKYLKTRIRELRGKGLRIAFDDMGTGYSTTNLLLDIPVDEVKLDSLFVRRLTKSKEYQMFANMLAEASARNMIQICFEGIEDKEAHEFIKQYGDSYCQGFYFAKPLLLDDFKSFINNMDN